MRKRESGLTVIPDLFKKLRARKGILLGYDFTDFIGFEAGTAHFYAFDSIFHNRTNFMQIGVKATLGSIQGMRAMIAYLSGLSTDIAYS